MFQKRKRDNQQRKLRGKGNGVKETPKMHPNRLSDGWCRDDQSHQWPNDSTGHARIPHHIMMVKKSGGGLGTLTTIVQCHCSRGFWAHIKYMEFIGGATLNGKQSARWQWRSHHYRNNGTIISLLISKREVTCLLSGTRFDEEDGNFTSEMGDGSCILNGKSGGIVGEGTKWDDYSC